MLYIGVDFGRERSRIVYVATNLNERTVIHMEQERTIKEIITGEGLESDISQGLAFMVDMGTALGLTNPETMSIIELRDSISAQLNSKLG